MKIKIRDNPSCYLGQLAGKTVDVETEHLFNDQFNTADFRVMLKDVVEIIDDIRLDLKKCGYCGFSHIKLNAQTCPKCNNNDHEYGLHPYIMPDQAYTQIAKGSKWALTSSKSSRQRYYLIKDNQGMRGASKPPNHYLNLFSVVNGIDRGNGYQGYMSIDYALQCGYIPNHAKAKIRRILKLDKEVVKV